MSEYPYFFQINQNKIDQDIFTASTSPGTSENCADYDRTTKWESIGSNDLTTEYLDIEFMTPDSQHETRTIDSMILVGINFKLFRLYKNNWNGSSYDGWVLVDTTAVNIYTTIIKAITSFSTHRIKLEIDTTIVADEEKEIAEFILTNLIWEATMPMDVFNIKNKQKAVIRRLYSGKGQKINHYDKWASRIEFKQITLTEMNELRGIYDTQNSFIVILEPYDNQGNYYKPEEFYKVLWKTPWTQAYFTKVKSAGYKVKIDLEEV